ncbi:MAG TPA: type IV pilus assembly protein PilM [Hyphomicrobiales bacterium]|nr:type IV pilus assembly protein PilM [Hyphomicrobiales bacterium]
MEMFKRRRALLGVDLGGSAVKLLALRRHGDRYRLTHCASCPLPDGAMREKAILATGEIAAQLRTLLVSRPDLPRRCALAVPGSSVISRLVALDATLSEPELLAQVELEAQQHVPYPREDILLDCVPRPDAACDPGQRMVLLAACRRDQVEGRLAALREAGATVAAVDGEAWAMERAFALLCRQGALQAAGVTAIVDCGAQTCTVHVLREGRSFYCREHASSAARLSRDTARSQALDTVREALAEQVERALRLFFAYGEYHQVDRIVLAGGGATVPELAPQVAQRLAVPVVLADPFAALRLDAMPEAEVATLRQQAPAWMLACGLALHGACDD